MKKDVTQLLSHPFWSFLMFEAEQLFHSFRLYIKKPSQKCRDGQIQILESNYNNQQQINNYRGWFDPQNSTTPGSVSYIYPGA